MIATTLISANEVVNSGVFRGSPLTTRFDITLLSPHIKTAEIRFLEGVLCRDFYNDLIAQKTTDDANYNDAIGAIVPKFGSNADYETLWRDYIYTYVSNAVFYIALPYITNQVTSAGVMNLNTEFAQNTGIEGAKFLQKETQINMEAMEKAMLDYICNNRVSKFPLYPKSLCMEKCGTCEDCESYDTVSAKKKNKRFGVIFYDAKGTRRNDYCNSCNSYNCKCR